MTLILPQYGLRRVVAGADPITYTDFEVSPAGARSSYTFSGVDLGSATSNKYVIVLCLWVSGFTRTLTSMTIAGTSASVGNITTGFAQSCIGYGFASVSSTSGDVVCNWSGNTASGFGEYIEVWEWAEGSGFTLSVGDTASGADETSPALDTVAGDGVFLLNTNNWASYDNAATVTDRDGGDGFAAGHVSPLDTITATPSSFADFTSTGPNGDARHAALALTPS